MNYLQLVQRLHSECGVSGSAPATTAGATGDTLRLCNWIAQAWTEVQMEYPDYGFMRKSFSFNTTLQKGDYDPIADLSLTDFKHWMNESFRIYLTSSGIVNQTLLQQYDYNSFRDYFLLGARNITYARPHSCAISPALHLLLGLAPNDVYTVQGEYFTVPIVLANDTDIPAVPSEFHMMIVYLAKKKFGMYFAASEVFQDGDVNYRSFKNKLELQYGPQIMLGGSLI